MGSYSRSVGSFDNDSDLTLMNGEDDDYQNEKIAYQVEYTSWTTTASTSFLSFTHCTARSLTSLGGILRFLVPSFLHPRMRQDTLEGEIHPTAYLDGMRGMAAFAVFLCHLSYGTWDLGHVYGTGESNENNFFLQLPIVRLIYAGPPMVAIFFVISGYALSYKPVKLMRAGRREALMTTMTSSVFRRALRLFLPCFASTFLVGTLCQFGYYERTAKFAQNMRAISEDHAWTQPDPMSQLLDWASQMFQFVNVFDWSLYAGSIALDRHLWTIPVEYRCSMALFLTHLLTARMSTRLRLSTLLSLMYWALHWNRWELIPFWAGAVLAELKHIQASSMTTAAATAEHDSILNTTRPDEHRPRWHKTRITFYAMTFISGLFLASFPDIDGHITPGYVYLNSLIPEYWSEKHRFWPTIAAVQIVWSVSHLKTLESFFNSSLMRYLGHVSFPLYLMHGPVIHTLGYAMMQHVYASTGTEDRLWLGVGFTFVAVVVIMAVVWVSDVFWRLIDQPSVRFARYVEGYMFVQ